MRHVMRWAVVVYLCVAAGAAFAQTLVVTSDNLQGWTLAASAGTGDEPPPSTYFATGYETPPAGDGSVHLNVGENGNDASQIRTNAFAGTRIADVTAVSYSTFTNVDVTGTAGDQAPYLLFHVDTDGDLGTGDVQLWFFEPAYQSQVPVMDTWQTWDAAAGGWYTTGGLAGSGPGANVKTFAQLLAVAPDATIVTSGTGGVRVVTGFGAGAWDFYGGAVDELRFATDSTDVTYDFEPDTTAVVTVTPSSLEEWTLSTQDEGAPGGSPSATIVSGPDTPPLPPGSLRLAVGTDGDDSAEARSDRWDGLYLRDLSALSYAAYHESGGSGGQLPYLILRVDYDNDGGQDDLLFFEPAYQTAGFCPSNPQPAIVSATWQSWEAANGCWWSLSGTAGASPGVDVKPLSTILAAQPDARLVTGASGGSFRVVAGFGAGAWDDFIGYVDELRVAVEPEEDTTYDFDPDPSITITGDSTLEPDAGTTPLVFGLTLSHAVSYSVTVQYATSDGTATVADADYAAESGTVTFDPGETTASISVDVNGDLKLESDESFFVDLSAPSGATLANTQGEGLIGNDDSQPQVSIAGITQGEGDAGTTGFVFNVTLTNPSAQTITVDYATVADGATAPADYATTSGTLTFDPGETLQTVTVQVVGETLFEDDESFFVNLDDATNATIDTAQATGTITNDDGQPEISIGNRSLEEGSSGTTDFVFDVTLSNPSEETVTVDFATADGSAIAPGDYTTLSGTVTFDPGETTQSVTVAVVGEDVFETDQTFEVNLSDPANAVIDDGEGIGTIVNDDGQPGVIIGDRTLPEGDSGTTDFVFDVTLSNASEETVTVDYATADDSAVAPGDYGSVSGTLTFDPGETLQTVTVAVVGDLAFEPDEGFTVNLSNAVNAGFTADRDGQGVILDDEGPLTVSVADASEPEGDSGVTGLGFLVTLSGPAADPVVVNYDAFETGSAEHLEDYDSEPGSITFEPGETEKTIVIGVFGDLILEPDETFELRLTAVSGGGAVITDDTATGTIENDDEAPTVSIGNASVFEGDVAGESELQFEVTLSQPSESTVTVTWETANDTATAPGDYPSSSGTATIEPNELPPNLTTTITIPVNGDFLFEADETFFVNLTGATNATVGDGQGVGTIRNDDAPPSMEISDVTLGEGTGGTTAFTFEVTLSEPSGVPFTVDYATAGNSAVTPGDYAPESGTLTFAPGDLSESVTVDVVGDSQFEANETFFLNLSNPSPGPTFFDDQGTGTIVNDDVEPSLSIGDATEVEGTSLVFTVTLSSASGLPVTVDFSTGDGSALRPQDYELTTGTLTFAPGDTEETITVTTQDDDEFEQDETFTVTLTDPDGATIADGQGIGTIEDNDDIPSISISDFTQTEETGEPRTFTFRVTLSHSSSSTIFVDFATSDGTAVSPDDYLGESGEGVFLPGETERSLSIAIVSDSDLEPDETFFVTLSNPDGATIADGEAVGTIVNDDGGVADLTVTKNGPASAAAGDPIEYTITVSNAGPQAATNVVVTDELPAGTTFVSATPSQGTCNGTTTVTCSLGTVADGAEATITLVVTAPSTEGSISNTATADADEIDPTVSEGTATTFVAGAAANAAGIPTLSEWALLLMLMGLAAAAATRLRG